MEFDPSSIVTRIEELVAQNLPDASAREMYGGIMLEIIPGDHSTRLCGYFVQKAHVLLEFSNGAQFDDPKNLLEGKGKFRRHLKFQNAEQLGEKDVDFFLQQVADIAKRSG